MKKPRPGHRFQAILTDREGGAADLECEHRARARCEDRIRCAMSPSACATAPCTPPGDLPSTPPRHAAAGAPLALGRRARRRLRAAARASGTGRLTGEAVPRSRSAACYSPFGRRPTRPAMRQTLGKLIGL